jgi:2-iminobutanoate/2-iminopropanoate deaminase
MVNQCRPCSRLSTLTLPRNRSVTTCRPWIRAGLVFVSGQLPARLDRTSLADMPFEAQARQSLANLLAIVEGVGLRRDRIAKVTAYLVGVEHWTAFNAIYAEAFGEHRPARSVVPAPALHPGYLIELEAIAVP